MDSPWNTQNPSVATSIPPVVEVQLTGLDGKEAIEMSGHGQHKKALCHIGALNGCLCRIVMNLNIDLIRAIECQQPGCETQWACSIVLHY
jgi:hypothetical protein